MHQSFVSTAPPPPGMGGDSGFSLFRGWYKPPPTPPSGFSLFRGWYKPSPPFVFAFVSTAPPPPGMGGDSGFSLFRGWYKPPPPPPVAFHFSEAGISPPPPPPPPVTKSNTEWDFFSFMSKRRKCADVLPVLAQNKSILHMVCT